MLNKEGIISKCELFAQGRPRDLIVRLGEQLIPRLGAELKG